jgi:hypothetical protein
MNQTNVSQNNENKQRNEKKKKKKKKKKKNSSSSSSVYLAIVRASDELVEEDVELRALQDRGRNQLHVLGVRQRWQKTTMQHLKTIKTFKTMKKFNN